jgi:3-keto-5-aminohexanoate cleavage enzyme
MVKLYFADGERSSFGLPPTERALEAYLELLEGSGLPWGVSLWGSDLVASPLAELALRRGGHLLVGLEPFAAEDHAPTNRELVAGAIALARRLGRLIATAADARRILRLQEGRTGGTRPTTGEEGGDIP